MAGPREMVDFDFGWRFAKGAMSGAEQPGFDDTQWLEVVVPHDWSIGDLEPLPDPGPVLEITKGTWRFAKGDDMAWKAAGFDDSKWEEGVLPATQEKHSQYKGKKSYGWFRRKLDVPAAVEGKALRLVVGLIRNADNPVRFKIDGPGVPAAVGNGDPSSLEHFQQPQRKAWRGRSLVILKSTREAGRVGLTATSEGLAPATVEIETR